jgi:hypothetical protein
MYRSKMALGRLLGGDGFEGQQPVETMQLIRGDVCRRQRTPCRRRMKRMSVCQWGLLTVSNLRKVLKICEDSITFLQKLHADFEHGSLTKGNVFSAITPCSLMLVKKMKKALLPLLV